MRKFLLCVPLAAVFLVSGDSFSQRPDQGGRRGAGGGRDGDAPSPSFDRPGGSGRRAGQSPTTRPSLVPESRPEGGRGGGGRRPPNADGNRPNAPNLSNRTGIGAGNRPGTGAGNRPPFNIVGGNRPGISNRPVRPGTGAGNRPPSTSVAAIVRRGPIDLASAVTTVHHFPIGQASATAVRPSTMAGAIDRVGQ